MVTQVTNPEPAQSKTTLEALLAEMQVSDENKRAISEALGILTGGKMRFAHEDFISFGTSFARSVSRTTKILKDDYVVDVRTITFSGLKTFRAAFEMIKMTFPEQFGEVSWSDFEEITDLLGGISNDFHETVSVSFRYEDDVAVTARVRGISSAFDANFAKWMDHVVEL